MGRVWAFLWKWEALLLFIAFIVITAGVVKYVHDQEAETHSALCGFRDGLADDVATTQAFLATHPQQVIHIGDVTLQRAEMVRALDAQKRRLVDLDKLNC